MQQIYICPVTITLLTYPVYRTMNDKQEPYHILSLSLSLRLPKIEDIEYANDVQMEHLCLIKE